MKHILMECKHLACTRRAFCIVKNMKDLYETTDPNRIINFLIKISLQSRISVQKPILWKDIYIHSWLTKVLIETPTWVHNDQFLPVIINALKNRIKKSLQQKITNHKPTNHEPIFKKCTIICFLKKKKKKCCNSKIKFKIQINKWKIDDVVGVTVKVFIYASLQV